jgi:hypothetical protein
MTPKLRRDRNAFLLFLAATPFALLAALPLAVTNGNAYVAAKAQRLMQAAVPLEPQSGAGATSE